VFLGHSINCQWFWLKSTWLPTCNLPGKTEIKLWTTELVTPVQWPVFFLVVYQIARLTVWVLPPHVPWRRYTSSRNLLWSGSRIFECLLKHHKDTWCVFEFEIPVCAYCPVLWTLHTPIVVYQPEMTCSHESWGGIILMSWVIEDGVRMEMNSTNAVEVVKFGSCTRF